MRAIRTAFLGPRRKIWLVRTICASILGPRSQVTALARAICTAFLRPRCHVAALVRAVCAPLRGPFFFQTGLLILRGLGRQAVRCSNLPVSCEAAIPLRLSLAGDLRLLCPDSWAARCFRPLDPDRDEVPWRAGCV